MKQIILTTVPLATVRRLFCPVLLLLAIGSGAASTANERPIHIERYVEHTVWGAKTNSLRSGLFVGEKLARQRRIVLQAGDAVPRKLEVLVGNDSSETVRIFYLPEEQGFKLTLLDSDGRPVPKTEKGRSLGKDIVIPPGTRWSDLHRARTLRGFPLFPGSVAYWMGLDVRDYFHLEKPGTYNLTLIQRVLGVEKGLVVVVELPPVKIEVVVE